jgi:flavin prenyltransferase
MSADRLVVGMAGEQGLDYGIGLLAALQATGVESHLVLTGTAAAALGDDVRAVRALADQAYAEANQAARISSGSFLTRGMVVVPCDARSLAAIALGLATNLVYRAADVTLKERRPLVLAAPSAARTGLERENIARAEAVPGLVVVSLEGVLEDAVAELLGHFGIEVARTRA